MHGRDERCIAKHMVTMRPKISNKENAEIYEGKNEGKRRNNKIHKTAQGTDDEQAQRYFCAVHVLRTLVIAILILFAYRKALRIGGDLRAGAGFVSRAEFSRTQAAFRASVDHRKDRASVYICGGNNGRAPGILP